MESPFRLFIKENIAQGNKDWMSLVRRRQDFEEIRDLLSEKDLFWLDQPVLIHIGHMTWTKDATSVNRPGRLSFELLNRLLHSAEGWRLPHYPPNHKMLEAQYKELCDNVHKMAKLSFERGCNDAISAYKIGQRYSKKFTPEKWYQTVQLFKDAITSLGYEIVVKERN